METVGFVSGGLRCEAWYLPGTPALATALGRPCVVMGHGFGAARDRGLLPYAERFAAAGLAVLVFDYRGFGGSDGLPRGRLSPRRQREDFHAALAYVRARPEVDPGRVALWGGSYSGGHVLAVAAADAAVAAVVSQVPVLDGRTPLAASGGPARNRFLRLAAHGLWDALLGAAGRRPHRIPAVAPPGGLSAATAGPEQGDPGELAPGDGLCARGVFAAVGDRPLRHAARVLVPLLLIAADRDRLAPPELVRAAAERAPAAELHSFDCGHFDVYAGEVFERASALQTGFLTRVLT